ncbi:radical SAM protein [Iningainema tapete]|uniref:Radical SAM protein n=1 Tax=Iningainema tapete BLCC-T55 TaxID=2748662 RepID=A0A8J6XB71_9CYAN|nr:radical SAM protein [Iningainema tapete]MBD2771875.1 radical SAM protein [Iningainema tapete BLCC-T55]
MSQDSSAIGSKRRSLWQMGLQGVLDGGPGSCHFAINSACNAHCGFCSFSVDRLPKELRQSVTLDDAKQAAEILLRNGVYFIFYVGGEPMLHPHLNEMIAHASSIGIAPMLVTNGSLLTPERVDALVDAGLVSVFISIDATDVEKHEQNRGLRGVCDRIRAANAQFRRRNLTPTASVTMSRLVDDYQKLPPFLKSLGFDSVTFSYPLTTLPSSYLSHAESELVDYTDEELYDCFEQMKALKKDFPVLNPIASIEDMQRHLRGEPEQFGCLAGWKFFYLDWHLNLYRCHNWDKPMCHITEFDGSQRVRDGCTSCMIDCYRDGSVMMQIGMGVSDGLQAAAKGNLKQAWKYWFDSRNLVSIKSVLEISSWVGHL